MFKNKVLCPVSRKIRRYFHFLLSLAYPIDSLDWAFFSVVILFRHWFPLFEKAEILCKGDQESHVILYISDKNGTSKLNKLTIFNQKWNFWNLVAMFDK